MARDYRPRQAKMLDSHSARQKRHEQQSGNRNLWLSMLVILTLILGGFWVVTHFASSGVKSGEKLSLAEREGGQSEAISALPEVSPPKAMDEAQAQKEPLEWLREPNLSAPDAKALGDEPRLGIFVEALPMPEAAKLYAEPEITFYDAINDIEVIPDDTTPISVALETPKYLLAGSFFSLDAAQRALKRLSDKGQKLFIRETWSHSRNRAVYVLYTLPYTNRLELNARKNELRALGAGVMEKEYHRAESAEKPTKPQ